MLQEEEYVRERIFSIMWRAGEGGGGTRTIDVDGPYRSVVSVVCAKALSVVGEPDVDDVVL